MNIFAHDKSLSNSDKELIAVAKQSMDQMDKLYGKVIPGRYLPWGLVRNPKTKEQKANWKKLCKHYKDEAEQRHKKQNND